MKLSTKKALASSAVVALALVALWSCAPQAPEQPAPAAPAGKASAAAEMPVATVLLDRPGLLVARLANGMDVLLAERHAAPVATVQVWVKCGSLTEDTLPGSGVSHFVEHMLFKGTARRGSRQMDREIGAAGGYDNAYTSHERTVYHITLPSKNFAVALDCLADAVQHAAFDPAECEREREVIIKEINLGEDDPGRVVDRYIRETEYRVAPERHPVIGYRNIFEKVSREQLLGYYHRMYVPNNMVFVAAGDFDARSALKRVQAAFAGFARRSFVPPVVPEEPEPAGPRELRVRNSHFRNARLCLSWPTVTVADPDMYPLDMGAALLGGGRTSRLYRRLFQQEKLVYSVSAGNHTPERTGRFSIYATLDEKNVERVLAIIAEEVGKLETAPIDPADMARVLSRHRAQEVYERETVDGLAASAAGDYLLTGDVDFSARYLERLARVKPAEVAAALSAYLVPERRSLVVVLPGGKAAAPVAGPKRPEPAAATAPKVEHVALPGGARLLLFERHDDPIVAISAVFLAGVRFEPEAQNGVSDLTASMLTRGTAKHSSDQLAEILEASGGSLGGFGGRNSLGVSAKFLSRDLELALGLVNEVLATPTFAEDEFQTLRARALDHIRRRAEDIDEVHELLVEKLLYAPHPYSRTAAGTEETVKALKREDLVAFHGRWCRPDNLVLCVSGDFKSEEVKKLVPELFREFLKPRADKLAPPAVAAEPVLRGEKRESQDMPGANQAILTLAFRGVDMKDPDRFPLEVLRGVLSGMGGRLFGELRDKQSLAYNVGAYLELGVDPGAVVFYIATEADQLDRSLAGIRAEVSRVKSAPVGPEELGRSKNQILGADASRRQSIAGTGQDLAFNELYGLGAEAAFARIREIEKVTAADVQRVARKYLTDEGYILAITKPAPEKPEAKPAPPVQTPPDAK